MSLELVVAPASEPVSLAEAKAHLRVDHDEEDALIQRLVVAARETAERLTGRALMTQTWRLWRDAWPGGVPCAIAIPKPPLIALSSVVTYDRSGAATTLSSDAYIVDSVAVPGRLVLKDTAAVPAVLREANAVAVEFQAGYGANASDVPAGLRAGILSLVAHLHAARGDGATPPPDALALFAPFKVMML